MCFSDHLGEDVGSLVVSFLVERRRVSRSSDFGFDKIVCFGETMAGIGSVSKAWRRITKAVLMRDDRIYLVASGMCDAAEFLSAFPQARSLRIGGAWNVPARGKARAGDIAAVLASRAVERLDLCSADMRSCSRLGNMAGLRALRLRCPQLRDLDLRPLAKLVSLDTLDLSRMAQLLDLRTLSALTGLQDLNLGSTDAEDLGGLSTLVRLRTLRFISCPEFHDLGPLSTLVALKQLMLSDCGQLRDLRPLSALVGLRSLDLSGCSELSNIQPLSALVGLQKLSLFWCEEVTDVTPLSSLVALQDLDLGCMELLTDVRPLSTLVGLQELNLIGCKRVTNVQALSALVALHSLDRCFCDELSACPYDCPSRASRLGR